MEWLWEARDGIERARTESLQQEAISLILIIIDQSNTIAELGAPASPPPACRSLPRPTMMSSLASGKRPLSHIAHEAELNGRSTKRTPFLPLPSPSSPSPSPSSLFKRDQTVFRILCPAAKTGSVIGKSGSIIKSIRQDTGATIRIEDGVVGCDERVVTISAKEEGFKPLKFRGPGNYGKVDAKGDADQEDERTDYLSDTDEENKEDNVGAAEGDKDGEDGRSDSTNDMTGKNGLAPVQEALLRVHLRIMEIDQSKPDDKAELNGEKCTRLLVPTTQVGCLLGKRGKIISQIRKDSGAQIRVLPRTLLPLCALPTDEIVQISGDLTAIRKALLAVSTQLRNNPPKKQPEENTLGPSKLSHYADSIVMGTDFFTSSAKLGQSLSPRAALGHSSALPAEKEEIMFRILCPKEKIGSIIGKGGSIVKSIREETGAKICIDVSSDVGDERVVRVSAPEMPDDPFPKAQKAVMIIHSKILFSDVDKDGVITTKMLVPADQAGCLLGRGGNIMEEMRKTTHTRIHIRGKEQLPPCAAETDELVEIIGNVAASREALSQITTRLRNNLFLTKFGAAYMDVKTSSFPGLISQNEDLFSFRAPVMPMTTLYDSRYAPFSNIAAGLTDKLSASAWPPQEIGGKMFSDVMDMGYSRDYLADTRTSRAFVSSQIVEVVVPEHAIASIVGESGSNIQQICKISGAKVKLQGLVPGASERIVEISGTPDQTHAAQSLLQAFVLSGQ